MQNHVDFYFTRIGFNKEDDFFTYSHNDYIFKVNIKKGYLNFLRKLISFDGTNLPLNLTLNYIQSHADFGVDILYSLTGFPKGFKTNFHVFLKYNNANDYYNYEDSNGFLHRFNLAENGSNLYFDSYGTGLMLIQTQYGFDVFDENGNHQIFDAVGRLIELRKEINENLTKSIFISYCDDSSFKIYSICDSYSKTIYFEYDASFVKIKFNNRTIFTIYMSNNHISSIVKNSNISGFIDTDQFNMPSLLSSITMSGGEEFEFEYNFLSLNTFRTNIKQDVYYFEYDEDNCETKISNVRGVEKTYSYSKNQNVMTTESLGRYTDLMNVSSINNNSAIKDDYNGDGSAIFRFRGQEISSISSGAMVRSDWLYSAPLDGKKNYLFYVFIDGDLGDGYLNVQLIDYENNKLAELIFDGKEKLLTAPIGIKGSILKNFFIGCVNNSPNDIAIIRAKIVPIIGNFELLCSNIDFGGPIFFYGDSPFYTLPKTRIVSVNNQPYALERNVELPDYLLDERLFYSVDSNFKFYSNDTKNLLCNNSVVCLEAPNGNHLIFDKQINNIYAQDENQISLGYVEFFAISGASDNSFKIDKISHKIDELGSNNDEYFCKRNETSYFVNENPLINNSFYDNRYNLLNFSSNNGIGIVNRYDNRKNLLSKEINSINEEHSIKTEFSYDLNDNLIQITELVGILFDVTHFGYTFWMSNDSIQYSNGLRVNYTFDSCLEENLNEINFNTYHGHSIITGITNLDANRVSYSSGNNDFILTFSDGELSLVQYNNSPLISISFTSTYIHDELINIGYCVSFSNGYTYMINYDEQDRMCEKENLLFEYDDYSNLISIRCNLDEHADFAINFEYGYYNQLVSVHDNYGACCINYIYDDHLRLSSEIFLYLNNPIFYTDYEYFEDIGYESIIEKRNVIVFNESILCENNLDSFGRIISNKITTSNFINDRVVEYCNDISNTLTNNFIRSITYTFTNNPHTSGADLSLIVRRPINETFEYDSNGRITFITTKVGPMVRKKVRYKYDEFGRLIREDNEGLNETVTFGYDSNGNINSKKKYSYTLNDILPTFPIYLDLIIYNSTYPNRLSRINIGVCQYDSYGNPTTYRGKNMTWIRGNLLSSVSNNASTISFSYDDLRRRERKITSSGTTTYFYLNNLLFREDRPNHTIFYIYSNNELIGFTLDNNIYLYEKNIFNDVVRIIDINDNVIASYEYDAWGNHKVFDSVGIEDTDSESVGNINPYRYRSYYYDVETGLFMMGHRFYDPEIGRFINPDDVDYLDPTTIGGLNLYSYCNNDPVNYCDPSGHMAISTIITLVVVGLAVVSTAATVTYGAITETPIVLDLSVSGGMGAGVGVKAGISMVIDFKNKSFGFYPHLGYFYGMKWNTFGISYSTGIVKNYANEGDYAGPFIDMGAGYYGGLDVCYDPRNNIDDTVKAYSLTFGNNIGGYYGYDYYWYAGSIAFFGKKRQSVGGFIYEV